MVSGSGRWGIMWHFQVKLYMHKEGTILYAANYAIWGSGAINIILPGFRGGKSLKVPMK